MNYEQIRHSSPAGLRKKKPARPLNAVPVLLFFAVHMIWFLTGGGLVQVYLGMGGVVITELVMLAMSIGFLFLMHADFRDVFPVRKPRWSALGACIILWAGITLANMVVSMLLMYWFPGPYNTLSNEDAFFNQFPILLQIVVIALLPAICEEAMHRGVMQSGLKKSIRNTPVLILVMGLLFAVFHLYPIKYPTMILLGCLMSYVLAVTGNMVYSSFLHFFNNLMSILLGSVTSGVPAMLFLQFITAASDYGGAASPDTGNTARLSSCPCARKQGEQSTVKLCPRSGPCRHTSQPAVNPSFPSFSAADSGECGPLRTDSDASRSCSVASSYRSGACCSSSVSSRSSSVSSA